MKAAVIGSPIRHSLSPTLHRAAYDQLKLPHSYEAIEITEDDFADFISALDSHWIGLSITMPLKEVAFTVAQKISNTAQISGSINTLVFGEEIFADNTDVIGITQALRQGGCNHPQTATIIGAGATARSAIVALGALGTESIQVLARNPSKSAKCIDLGNELGITIDATTEFSNILFQSEVTINTTPKGVADDFAQQISNPRGLLLDVVYDPWPTQLAAKWLNQNCQIIPGHQMLLHQAVRQVELMTGLTPDVSVMQDALQKELERRAISH